MKIVFYYNFDKYSVNQHKYSTFYLSFHSVLHLWSKVESAGNERTLGGQGCWIIFRCTMYSVFVLNTVGRNCIKRKHNYKIVLCTIINSKYILNFENWTKFLLLISNVGFADFIGFHVQHFHENCNESYWWWQLQFLSKHQM